MRFRSLVSYLSLAVALYYAYRSGWVHHLYSTCLLSCSLWSTSPLSSEWYRRVSNSFLSSLYYSTLDVNPLQSHQRRSNRWVSTTLDILVSRWKNPIETGENAFILRPTSQLDPLPLPSRRKKLVHHSFPIATNYLHQNAITTVDCSEGNCWNWSTFQLDW